MKLFIKTALFIIPFCQLALAQQNLNQVLTDWYLEERFILADQDKDAYLDAEELAQFPREFGYYLDSRNFSLTDIDGDRKLSFRETKKRVVVEFKYRYAREISTLNDLKTQYPALVGADASYLKANPALTANLLGNLHWMNTNADLAREIYQDEAWMQAHPGVLTALQRNLCWLVTHPSAAQTLYKNLKLSRQAPELLGWRAAHKNLLRRYRDLPEDVVLSFLPQN